MDGCLREMRVTGIKNEDTMKLLNTVFVVMLLSFAMPGYGQGIEKKKFNFSKSGEDGIGYTQAIKAGNTIYISGIAARGPMNEAIKKIYDRLAKVLAYYDATLENVVKETAYTTALDDLIASQDLRKEYYKGDYPASSWVEIKRLYAPDAILEIEFVAVLKGQ